MADKSLRLYPEEKDVSFLRQYSPCDSLSEPESKLPEDGCLQPKRVAAISQIKTCSSVSTERGLYHLYRLSVVYIYRVIQNDCRGVNKCHLVLQMQPHVISFCGVT